jgi:hypothetical protein
MKITVDLGNIKDQDVKQALEHLVEQLNLKKLLLGDWDVIDYTFPSVTAVDFELNHGLKFKPTDIIELHRDSTLSVTYNSTKFTPTTVYLTATGSGNLRFLVGKQIRGG